MKEITDINRIVRIIQDADIAFEAFGGGTKHYVRDVLLPLMEKECVYFCEKENESTLS